MTAERRVVESILASVGDDEELAHELRLELQRRFGWSLAYADEAELRFRFASHHGYDDAEDVPEELWAKVWPILRGTSYWIDADWVDDFVGDRIDWWLDWEEPRSFDGDLRHEINAWENAADDRRAAP